MTTLKTIFKISDDEINEILNSKQKFTSYSENESL